MGSRIVYIDTAKALAMLFVIVGHCDWIGAVPRLHGMIYSFHMPVFFILSGYFVRRLRFRQAICKYAKAYLRPYLLLSLFIIFIAMAYANHIGSDIKGAFCQSITRILWVSAGDRSNFLFDLIPDMGPSWFLPALFTACVLYSSLIMRFGLIEQLLLCLLLASYAVSSITKIQLPFGTQYGMVALLYMYIGNHLEEFHVLDKIRSISLRFKLLSIGSCVLLTFIKGGVFLYAANLGYSIQGTVCSVIMSLSMIYICKQCHWHLEWIGGHTLEIFMAHVMFREFIRVFGCGFVLLPFKPIVNLFIELPIQIAVALLLGYALAKIKMLWRECQVRNKI